MIDRMIEQTIEVIINKEEVYGEKCLLQKNTLKTPINIKH